MERGEDGWFERTDPSARAGTLYQYRINGDQLVPDPASRFQPEDCEGPSEVIDPAAFEWHDSGWKGRPWHEAVIYELHVGCFSREGTYFGVKKRLESLRDIGISAIELMPLSDFAGKRSWGYDGVLPYAPDSAYGTPGELKSLVQAAHDVGLMIFLDVVYNHFGPKGNFLNLYAPQFFTSRHKTPWGAAINFDGEGSRWVREYFVQNALYWLDEYRFDGLRFDAVHAIIDESPSTFWMRFRSRVRERFPERLVHLVLENDAESGALPRRPRELHRPMERRLSSWVSRARHGRARRLLHRLRRCAGEVPRALPRGGLRLSRRDLTLLQRKARGAERSSAAARFRGFHTEPRSDRQPCVWREDGLSLGRDEVAKALTAILLLAPSPPLLFMGEEWGCRQPFLFFCDFDGELGEAVRNGRREEFARFAAFRDPAARERIPDPLAVSTFEQAVLKWEDRDSADGKAWLAHYSGLLRLREAHLWSTKANSGSYRMLSQEAFEVRWTLEGGGELMLVANCGDARATISTSLEAKPIWSNGLPGSPWSVNWYLTERNRGELR